MSDETTEPQKGRHRKCVDSFTGTMTITTMAPPDGREGVAIAVELNCELDAHGLGHAMAAAVCAFAEGAGIELDGPAFAILNLAISQGYACGIKLARTNGVETAAIN